MGRMRTITWLLVPALVAGCSERGQRGDRDADADAPADGLVDVPGDCVAVEEACNYLDDDCDGEVDEGFDLTSDPANCGDCGVSCVDEHTTASCVDSVCVIEECADGWHDVDGDPWNGCEYECTPTAGSESPDDGTCADGIDNDCDGRTDGDDADCSDCVSELCNGEDDDCDDLIDEDFDLDRDPLNCGSCGHACSHRPHSTPGCEGGTCTFVCDEGWADGDGDPANGCEERSEPCTPVPGGTETACNGVDEDCDTVADEDYVATTCGTGGCARTSTCVAGTEDCTPGSPGVDDDCDAVDDDCDGPADEHWVAGSCGTGACLSTETCVSGTEDCTPGSATGADDDCDAVDDDCDGSADEHWVAGSCGTGACLSTETCISGTEDCTPGSPTGADTDCDAVDDDCDGPADEHWVAFTCGWGQCEATATCTAGSESCVPRDDASLWPSSWVTFEADAVTAINARRASGATCNGTWYPPVAALTMNTDLREAGRCHSLDMAENDFFSHTGSDGSSFSTRCTWAGYTASPRGENIAAGYTTPSAAVAGWMSSTTGHCEMIMNSTINEVGVGYSYSSSSTWRHYWTADFGRR